MIFKQPWILALIIITGILVYISKRSDLLSSVKFSSGKLLNGLKPTIKIGLSKNLIYFRAAAAVLFIVALARPQTPLEEAEIHTEGIDIVLAVDSSGSMLAEDFTVNGKRKNRLQVVKDVVEDFIRLRKSDRIGMITFAARAYTVCPLTLDYDWLVKNLERVKIGLIEDGTAVGSAISSSLNRLKDTEAKSKIIILLTDGINNAGNISPLTAAEAAKALGVKIYTIGAGTEGMAPYPFQGPWGKTVYQNAKIEIDEDTLKQIAETTNGLYFRAADTASLKDIYKEIDALEKTPVEEKGFQEFNELFSSFLALGMIFLALEVVLSNTILRKLP
ncbi:MAG: VWA domain-containing protein [Candidatus Omnitrophica bacterium]|nr:VWA domain-containing protein [Candidatus Omnitrophota bacterium]